MVGFEGEGLDLLLVICFLGWDGVRGWNGRVGFLGLLVSDSSLDLLGGVLGCMVCGTCTGGWWLMEVEFVVVFWRKRA